MIEALPEVMVGHVRWALVALYGAVACLLLIACANVAGAILARASGRQHEMAVRVALGATGSRLVRLSLAEALLMAASAGALGLAFAYLLLEGLMGGAPAAIPRLDEVVLDRYAVAVALALSLLTALAVGFAPWIRFGRTDMGAALKGGRTASATRGRARAGVILVTAEIALTLVLLAGAGLLIRSFLFLKNLELGLDPQGVWTAELAVPMGEFTPESQRRIGGRPEWERLGVFYASLVSHVRNLPGVESAATVSGPELAGDTPSFFRHGREFDSASHADRWPVMTYEVTVEYFRVLRIPMRRGRTFTDCDVARGWLTTDVRPVSGVAIVNEAMAGRFWPGRDPIGQEIALESDRDGTYRTIIGVAADVRRSAADPAPEPILYVPRAQSRPDFAVRLLVRMNSQRPQSAEALRAGLRAFHPTLSISHVRPLDDLFAESLAEERFTMILVSTFGVLALLLAAVGLYGVIAFIVSQRTREIGVRVALGAGRADIARLVVRQAARPVLLGLLLGTLGAVATSRLVAALVVGVGALDPLVFTAVEILIVAVAALAVLAPTRTAASVDPILVLRQE